MGVVTPLQDTLLKGKGKMRAYIYTRVWRSIRICLFYYTDYYRLATEPVWDVTAGVLVLTKRIHQNDKGISLEL